MFRRSKWISLVGCISSEIGHAGRLLVVELHSEDSNIGWKIGFFSAMTTLEKRCETLYVHVKSLPTVTKKTQLLKRPYRRGACNTTLMKTYLGELQMGE